MEEIGTADNAEDTDGFAQSRGGIRRRAFSLALRLADFTIREIHVIRG
jgi:hypothetical protein